MSNSVPMVELWRADVLESVHHGDAVICRADGSVEAAWGDPGKTILPRSACKILQALPLVESGAADAAGLSTRQLALSCASHIGARMHTGTVEAWLADLGLKDDDLRCGPQMPDDAEAAKGLICADRAPCQVHNNCSGKHAGFLTLSRHLGGGPEYIDPDHPVQRAVREAVEDMTGEASPGFGIDGCSAPNFATTLKGLARAMARIATAEAGTGARAKAARRLREAMIAHPELVSGEGRPCTELMRATRGRAAIKTGAEGVYTGIVPELGLGIALKITDGAGRGAQSAIAALLVRLGVLDAADPAVARWMAPRILNRREVDTGQMRPVAALLR